MTDKTEWPGGAANTPGPAQEGDSYAGPEYWAP